MAAVAAEPSSRGIVYAPAPGWVVAAPVPTTSATPPGMPLRVIYADTQVRLGADADETHTAYRVKLLAPEALPLGNVTLEWSPATDRVTVHALRILREGQVIDVLAGQKFDVIQRENNLERSMLDGALTATLQAPGLRVGDELEFAVTVRRRDANLGGLSQGFTQLPPSGVLGSYRLRFLSPKDRGVRWRATADLVAPSVAVRGTEEERVYELRDPQSVIPAEGAPARFALHRTLQYSTMADWAAVSRQLWPMFDAASRLKAGSPLHAEIDRIARASAEPTARVEAALRLVQEQIRYVYVGLDGANYRPASADDSWARRFGDCKAKTVLLVAVLRGLGIPAEAVLVNSAGGDGLDQRLAMPGVFDHVVVRATVDGRSYWLDGTRLGDRRLATLPAPGFRWGLPLRAAAAELEAVEPVAPTVPLAVMELEVDASAGYATPAKVAVRHIIRGDEAQAIRARLVSLTAADADRAQRAYWREQENWVEPSRTTWRYDEDGGVVVLSLSGEGKPSWEGDDKEGRSLDILGAGFTPPAPLKRPKEQDQTIPWATDFPRFRCWATTIRLPANGPKRRWSVAAKPVDRQLGGVDYWRQAWLDGNVVRTVMSRRTYRPEISAIEAGQLNEALAGFDNNISRVFEVAAGDDVTKPTAAAAFLARPIDWSSSEAPCLAPERRRTGSHTVRAGS